MKYKLHISTLLLVLLTGCSSFSNKLSSYNINFQQQEALQMAAKLLDSNSIQNDSNKYYAIGKNLEKELKIDEAIVAYSKSIKLNEANTKSIEALALLYVKKGDLYSSIKSFENLVKIDPSSYNYNNLGYAYYLNMNFDAAKVAYTQSLKIDSAYKKAINNLNLISQQDLTTEEAKVAKQEAVKALDEELHVASQESSLNNANDSGVNDVNENSSIKKVMKNVYEIIPINQKVTINEISNQVDVKGLERNYAKLENRSILSLQIVNGNGTRGMARLVAGKITNSQYEVKLANLKPYNKAKTIVQYRSENYEEVIKVMIGLKNMPEIVLNNNLPKSIGVRLILGKDFDTNNI